jgi:hypothetical protein
MPIPTMWDSPRELDENAVDEAHQGTGRPARAAREGIFRLHVREEDEYQAVLALHGHIRESRSEAKIGRAQAINTGSAFNSGRIHGAIMKLAEDTVASR